MKIFINKLTVYIIGVFMTFMFTASFGGALNAQEEENNESIRDKPATSYIYIKDGQLTSLPTKVYLFNTGDIPVNRDNVTLELYFTSRWNTQKTDELKPHMVLRYPRVIENQGIKIDQDDIQNGTKLIFEGLDLALDEYYNTQYKKFGKLGKYTKFLHPAFKVMPILKIESKNFFGKTTVRYVTPPADPSITIGYDPGTMVYDALFILIILFFIFLVKRSTSVPMISIVCEADGKLSLSKLQLLIWTSVISVMTLDYSLTQFRSPEIPDSLLALMGLSALTRGLGRNKDDESHIDSQSEGSEVSEASTGEPESQREGAPVPDKKAKYSKAELREKRKIYNLLISPQSGEIDLFRFQMFVWTIVSVFLFVYKSWNEGELWDVPWVLVGLTGFSQASYIIPKRYQRSNR